MKLNTILIKTQTLFILLLLSSLIFSKDDIAKLEEREEEYLVPKVIWMYWEGEMNNFTKSLLHHSKQSLINYKFVLLNQNTVRNYVDTELLTEDVVNQWQPTQSDYYRFLLIYQYGGIWVDCSTYIKNEIFFNKIIEEMYEKKVDLCLFNWRYQPWNNLELGVLLGSKKNHFSKLVLKEMGYGFKITIEEYEREKIKEGIKLTYHLHYMEKGDDGQPVYNRYFFEAYCVQYVLQIKLKMKANLLVKDAGETFFKMFEDCNTDMPKMAKRWVEDKSTRDYEIVKFVGDTRKLVEMEFNDII